MPSVKESHLTQGHSCSLWGGRFNKGQIPLPQSKTSAKGHSSFRVSSKTQGGLCCWQMMAQPLPLPCPASLTSFRECFWKHFYHKNSAHKLKIQSVFETELICKHLVNEETKQKLPLLVIVHLGLWHPFNGCAWLCSLITVSSAIDDLRIPLLPLIICKDLSIV